MSKRYQVIDHEGSFAVRNTSDDSILKSKESGKIIAFHTIIQAEKLRDFLEHQYNLIVEASQTWWIKEKVKGNQFVIRKLER